MPSSPSSFFSYLLPKKNLLTLHVNGKGSLTFATTAAANPIFPHLPHIFFYFLLSERDGRTYDSYIWYLCPAEFPAHLPYLLQLQFPRLQFGHFDVANKALNAGQSISLE